MKNLIAALLALVCAPALAAQAPDTSFVTGPNFQQTPPSKVFVTPTGGVQQTLPDALSPQGLNLTGANASGANVTPSGATTSFGMANRAAEVINVMDYGAKCDSSTDDTAAINAAFARVRALTTSNIKASLLVTLPRSISNGDGTLNFRRCIVNSSINATGIYSAVGNALNVTVDGQGTTIYCRMAGSACIDAMGSNQIVWKDVSVFSDSTNVPTTGIQFGRTAPTVSDWGGGANMRFDNMQIVGFFSIAGAYNFAAEEVIWTRPRIVNQYDSASAYAYIADGFNHFGVTSAFIASTAPTDTAQSFEETNIYGGSMQGDGASMVSSIWLGAVTQHRFHNTYLYNGSGAHSCVSLYSASAGIYMGIKGLDLDVHCEGSAVTNKILLTGTLASPTIRDLTVRDVYEFSTGTIFKLGGSATSATLEHPIVAISGGPASPVFTMFDTPSNYFVTGGDFYVYSATPLGAGGVVNFGPINFSGRITAPGKDTMQSAGTTCSSTSSIAQSTSNRNWMSVAACTTTLFIETTSGSAVRLTADGSGAATAGNCLNIATPIGSLSAATVTVVARDRTTTSNTVAWNSWNMTYGSPSNAATTAVVTTTKPTAVSTGTVTGTDISATADTTNGCLNLSWTPPTSNTDMWDVVASVSYTQVR